LYFGKNMAELPDYDLYENQFGFLFNIP